MKIELTDAGSGGSKLSNRTVKHSSRYNGPAGDSRPADQIFAGMEKRREQSEQVLNELEMQLDKALADMTLSSPCGAVDAIKERFISWWMEHDLDAKERYRKGRKVKDE